MSLLGHVLGTVVRLSSDGLNYRATLRRLLEEHDAGRLTPAQIVAAVREIEAGRTVVLSPDQPRGAITYLPPAKRPRVRGRK